MTSPRTATQWAAWLDRRRGDPVTFTIDGLTHTVPEQPARVWFLAVLSDDPTDWLLDALDDATAAYLWGEAVELDSPITPDLLHEIGRAVLTQVACRPWWQVTSLLGSLAANWSEFDAIAADRGVSDLLGWPLERLCNWVYGQLVAKLTPAAREQFDRQLDAPPQARAAAAEPVDDASWDDAGAWLQNAARFAPNGGRATTRA